MGAPIGNTNAMTHGRRRSEAAARCGFRARQLPPGYRYVASEAAAYASALYTEVQAAFGDVSREAAELIEAAAAWNLHHLYCLRSLRIDGDGMKPMERVQLSREIASASQRRTDLVRLLKIDEANREMFDGTIPNLPADHPSADDGSQAKQEAAG